MTPDGGTRQAKGTGRAVASTRLETAPPTLDEIAKDPTRVGAIPPEVATSLLTRCLAVQVAQRRLDERQVDISWPDLMRDLTEVRAVNLTLDGQRYRLRTDLHGSAYHAFAAAGVRPPAIVTPLGPAPAASPPPTAEPTVEVPA
jgi:hypothetical protein